MHHKLDIRTSKGQCKACELGGKDKEARQECATKNVKMVEKK